MGCIEEGCRVGLGDRILAALAVLPRSISNLFDIESFRKSNISLLNFCTFFQEMWDRMDAGPEEHRTKGCRT